MAHDPDAGTFDLAKMHQRAATLRQVLIDTTYNGHPFARDSLVRRDVTRLLGWIDETIAVGSDRAELTRRSSERVALSMATTVTQIAFGRPVVQNGSPPMDIAEDHDSARQVLVRLGLATEHELGDLTYDDCLERVRQCVRDHGFPIEPLSPAADE